MNTLDQLAAKTKTLAPQQAGAVIAGARNIFIIDND